MSLKSEQALNGFLNSFSKIFGQLHEQCEKYKSSFRAGSLKFIADYSANDSEIKKPKKKIIDPLKSDPNAPKKPIIQAYLIFYTDVRNQRQKENPLLANMDLTKVIADEWNKLTKEQRKPYEDKAHNNRVHYERELDAYLEKNPEMKAKLSSKRKRRKASSSMAYSQSDIGTPNINVMDVSSDGTGLDENSQPLSFSQNLLDVEKPAPGSPEGSFDYSSSEDEEPGKKLKV